MRFAILGPLDITDDCGEPVRVSRRLHRQALSLLLLRAGQAVPHAELARVLWASDPPQRAAVSLRSCVYGLRRTLPDPGRLRTRPDGYQIEVHPGELDLRSFQDLADKGMALLARAKVADAAGTLAKAMCLWREPALADLPAVREHDGLTELHAQARDALMDARLALGQHQDALTELRNLVAAEPLREHLWAQLLVALYRCGARAEALSAFGTVRSALVKAYGIEPGPELQELHRKILADAPDLIARVPAAAITRRPTEVARQLPPCVTDFAGREDDLKTLSDRLPGDGMTVTALTGMPGAGKTALALRAAHMSRQRFPDGQFFADLSEHGHERDPQAVLGELIRALGVPAAALPAPGREREALFRSLVADQRVLVVADGASSAAQVRPLLPGSPGSAVLVTSRARLGDLEGARLIELGGLSRSASLRLLASASGRDLSGPQAASAEAIAEACADLPLAIRIAGARLAEEPDLPPAWLAALLASAENRLDELSIGDQSVRARLAAATGPQGRRALALLAAADEHQIPRRLARTLIGGDDEATLVRALTEVSLLRRAAMSGPAAIADSGQFSYQVHPLVLGYGRELLAADPDLARLALERLGGSHRNP